jgi:hypothetical protein
MNTTRREVIKGIGALATLAVAPTQALLAQCINSDSDFLNYNLVRHKDPVAQPWLNKPSYLQPIIDPAFGTKLTRVTGDPGTPIPNTLASWQTNARHNYSKDPVWNADQSLMVLKWRTPGHLFLDGSTYNPVFNRTNIPGETRWHPTDPNIAIAVSGSTGSVIHWNPRTNTQTTVFPLTGYSNASFGPYEGSPSWDGNRLVVVATRNSDGKRTAFAVDVKAQHKYPDIDLAAAGVTNLDWASISAGGNFVVMNGSIDGGADRTKVFSLDGKQQGPLWSIYGTPSHYDFAIDPQGNEVAFGETQSYIDNIRYGSQIMRRLDDGSVTLAMVGGFPSHSSCKAYRRSTWAYVTNPYNGTSYPPQLGNVAQTTKLDGSQKIERWCHLRSTFATYDSQPHVCPSPDGKRLIFASDWGNSTGNVSAYVCDIEPLKIVS